MLLVLDLHLLEGHKGMALIFLMHGIYEFFFPLGPHHALKCEHGKQDGYIFRSVSTTRCVDGAEETEQTFVRYAESLDVACFSRLMSGEMSS